MNKIQNIFHDIPKSADEIIQELVRFDNVRIERIISNGNSSPEGFWYDQHENEWVIVLKGSAKLEFEDDIIELAEGDYILIPAHMKHRVAETSADGETVWLAFFWV
jgi:cupin 2 domain-containing protein